MPKNHTCCYCHCIVLTFHGIRKHYARSKACNQKYQDEIRRTAFTVFNEEQDDASQPPATPNIMESDSEPESDGYNRLGDDFVPLRRCRSESLDQEAESSHNQSKRAQMEEVDDDDDVPGRYPESYPRQAGQIFGDGITAFEKLQEKQRMEGLDPWAPFANEEEWELARWLMKNMGQTKSDDFLKLPIVNGQPTASEL
jgi:hypothetical protein